jgi:hypothetical protein
MSAFDDEKQCQHCMDWFDPDRIEPCSHCKEALCDNCSHELGGGDDCQGEAG